MTVRPPPRPAGVAVALVALSLLAASGSPKAWAQDASEPHESAALAAGQRPAPGGHGNAAAATAGTEAHRLPPDSITKQTLALPGRSLAFTAIAGSIRLQTGNGEPPAH